MAGLTAFSRFVAAFRPKAEDLGFAKREIAVFSRDSGGETIDWLGLNHAMRPGGVLEINPVLGVRHQVLERELARIRGQQFHSYLPPTISTHAGYLTRGRYDPLLITEGEPVEGAAQMLGALVTEIGLPFMERHSTLETVAHAMTSGMGSPEQLAYRIPVAFWLLGDSTSARRATEEHLRRLGSRDDEAARAFGSFARAMLSEMDGSVAVAARERE